MSGINGISDDENGLSCLLTNARSLLPKMDDLIDAFRSLNLNLAIVTETWFKGGKALRDRLVDIEGASGIRVIHRSRDGRMKKCGGGVAIAFSTTTCNLKNRQLKFIDKNHEGVCVTGRVGKLERRVVVFGVYIPPNMRAAEVQGLKEALGTEITEVRKSLKNPVIMVGGDFNHRDFSGALREVDEFEPLTTGPTRGVNTIDVVYTNIDPQIAEVLTLPPLSSGGGSASDHKCIFVKALFPPQRGYEWITKMRRSRNASSEAAFVEDMKSHDWSLMTGDADEMANHLEETIKRLTEVHFPLERTRKRSTEHPWINRTIRKLWKKKIRIYKKGGKSDEWWSTDRVLQQKIEEARLDFVERLLEDGGNGRSFYAATKSLSSAAPAGRWQVSDLFPGVGPADVGKEILRYYSGICTDPVNPIEGVTKQDGGLGSFTEERTIELLRNAKKTDSRVDGDPLAHMVRQYPEAFAEPVSGIFNKINREGLWPKSWKTEHITVIPKNPNPADLSECRNISCTSAFSKVLEGVVLQQLRTEIERDDSQFGGVPKCGAEHMLINIWEEILGALEGGRSAAVLLGVDYEKAFNRMGHAECLKQLRELGASPGSLSLVRSFLEGRTMTISVDGCKAAPVNADRGSPQGSVLGCYLYCATTQRLTSLLRPNSNMPKAFLYVDDTTLLDVVSMDSATRHLTTGTTKEEFRELELGADFGVLVGRAEDIGMKINDKKNPAAGSQSPERLPHHGKHHDSGWEHHQLR